MLKLKQAALVLIVVALAAGVIAYVLVRREGFRDVGWWVLLFLWIDVVVISVVVNAKWIREAAGENAPGGFEVFTHDPKDKT